MRSWYRGVCLTLIGAVVVVLPVACSSGEAGDCPESVAGTRVPLTATGNPVPDLSRLVMCTNEQSSVVVLTNGTEDVWLVLPRPQVPVTQHGGVPTEVQIFRTFPSGGTIPGTFLEPGTAVRLSTHPALIGLTIDPALQSRWSTFTLLDETMTAAREKLPELINNPRYRSAVASCLEAGARMTNAAAAARYDTQTLLDNLGLVTGNTRCAADLAIAEQERQRLARGTLPELKPTSFASRASSMAGKLDKLLGVIGRVARV